METPQIQQEIISQLQFLNAFQLAEVLDFVEFLHTRQCRVSPDTGVIEELCGKYKDRLSSSEEFARRKQEEIQLEEAKQ